MFGKPPLLLDHLVCKNILSSLFPWLRATIRTVRKEALPSTGVATGTLRASEATSCFRGFALREVSVRKC